MGKRTNKWAGFWAASLICTALQAQQPAPIPHPGNAAEKPLLNTPPASAKGVDSTSLLFALRKGRVQGNFRYFLMATDNAPGLTDYVANAVGGQLKYETAPFHRFQLGVGSHYIYNLATSDLATPDSLTAQPNRYEIGLFDIVNPGEYRDLYRLEELYLKFGTSKLSLRLGKQLLNTPFINLQDGRMRPTAVEGFWADWQPRKTLRIEGGWLYRISPRSTTAWYNVGQSIGRYPVGLSTTGIASGYRDALDSKGVFIAGINWQANSHFKFTAWDFFTEGIFNTAMAQAEWGVKPKEGQRITLAGQAIRQDAVDDGGNADPTKAYLPAASHAWVIGGKLVWKTERWETSLNYTRITAAGRYLMPREWGRDPFFTFMPRERNEGFGDVHAAVVKAERNFPKIRLKAALAAGYFNLPEANDFRLNKYGMTSYTQANAEIRYQFPKPLDGLEAQLLVVGKRNAGDLRGNRRFEFNKVNMLNYNFVLNYNF
jgi:hypothetical protein